MEEIVLSRRPLDKENKIIVDGSQVGKITAQIRPGYYEPDGQLCAWFRLHGIQVDPLIDLSLNKIVELLETAVGVQR